MVTDRHREELVIVLLSSVGVPLDAKSVAATYDTPVEEWEAAFDRLERDGYVEYVGNGLYRLTPAGKTAGRSRGSSPSPLVY